MTVITPYILNLQNPMSYMYSPSHFSQPRPKFWMWKLDCSALDCICGERTDCSRGLAETVTGFVFRCVLGLCDLMWIGLEDLTCTVFFIPWVNILLYKCVKMLLCTYVHALNFAIHLHQIYWILKNIL